MKLEYEIFGNIGDVETLVQSLQTAVAKRLKADVQAGIAALRADPPLSDDDVEQLYERALVEWGGEFKPADVRTACDNLLSAAKDADAKKKIAAAARALEDRRRGRYVNSTSDRSESKEVTNSETKEDEQQGEESHDVSADAKKKERLAAAMYSRFAELFGQARADEICLGGAALTDAEKQEVIEAVKGLPEANGLGLDDLAERLSELLSDVSAAVERGREVESQLKALAAERERFAKGTQEYQELDARIRSMTVTITRTIRCGICGNLDQPGSGCGFGGNSRERCVRAASLFESISLTPLPYSPAAHSPSAEKKVIENIIKTYGQH